METATGSGKSASGGGQRDRPHHLATGDERGTADHAQTKLGDDAEPKSSCARDSDSEEDITLGPGWMQQRAGSSAAAGRSLGGSREAFTAGKGGGGGSSATNKLVHCYTKEELLALHNVGDECPPDFLALPYILSRDTLVPVNLSSNLLKEVRLSIKLVRWSTLIADVTHPT